MAAENYIKRMERELREANDRIARAEMQITSFREHLMLPKFRAESELQNYINTSDVSRWLDDISKELVE
jgi:hypothetical protein